MWLARVLGSSVALLASAAMAAPGDALVVTGDVVNVRAGPGMSNPVLFHAFREQQVVELTRTDDWIEVQILGRAENGWIHRSLLQEVGLTPPPASQTPGLPGPGASESSAALTPAAIESAPSGPTIETALPASDGDALARFRSIVDGLNARAVTVAGVELFTGVEAAGDGTVQVLVTETWDLVPEPGRKSYTNALFKRWQAATGGSGPLRVQVVDPSGTVVSEKSG